MSEISFSQKTKEALESITIKNKCCKNAYEYGKSLFSETETDRILDNSVFECQNCRSSFLRGVFIVCGTVSSPESSTYHLEFNVQQSDLADDLCSVLIECGYTPKLTYRKHRNVYGMYFHDSEVISDLLAFIGANTASFDLIDSKILRDLRNEANRQANCETANISKTISASGEQMDAIYKILDGGYAEKLSEELRITLDLRAAYPHASLEELAAMHTPPLTKSGVNHRLQKIKAFAEKLR